MFRLRLAPLRAAVLLAAGFVLLRVVYRVVFGGAGVGTELLLDLPRLRLDGPFSHITLFGPITLIGLGNAALSAVPVAAVIVFFGLLNAVINVQSLFARGAGRGPLRAISRSLVIAWATFPALLESVRRVRVARALRGERSIASLLVPVFEQTIERALALAASMETRGFASTRAVPGVCGVPVVLTDAALDFGGDWHLDDLNVILQPGTLTVIVGATGSGKTSLLHSLSGLFQHFYDGTQHGRIHIAGADRASTPPRDTAGFVGLVAQNVRLGFATETVHDEIGFSLAVRNVTPSIVHARVLEIAARLRIEHLVDRPIEQLSAGEASLVAIAAALVNHPILLLVDEPLADLDTDARDRVCTVLGQLAHEAGVCVVIAEHNTGEFTAVADAWLQIRGSHLHDLSPQEFSALAPSETDSNDVLPADSQAAAPANPPGTGLPEFAAGPGFAAAAQGSTRTTGTRPAEPLASIRRLSVRHRADLVVDDVSFAVEAAELVALRGSNGAGKSSLLRAIALPSAAETVIVAGHDVHSLKRRARRQRVALVPENFDDLLFAITVTEECRRADHRLAGADTARTFAYLLGFDTKADAAPLLERHPRDLSSGERLCLVIAIQLAARPDLLLVDEPTRGLDRAARALVSGALVTAASHTSAVLFATHDDDFARGLATRTLRMQAGRLDATIEVLS
ncbi:ATP-binding cassette domain-containing protein [Cryobacterium sp. PH31-L1]|uniref:ATP-binding cassette domain-containing protein n=1 Tax=Cryobacterium sp. PH31-L1 TaxID=3046199 RepID=UPI0024B88706|nr:ATP-binding cassette domain-containing protein [Cryobacterium sp. PH31-L1]MDJ0378239.1 ATP-binding cassette domain-containing protein [Cryobacterium sp. PH31-L1]